MSRDDEVHDNWLECNRRMWDERVPIHVESTLYDVPAFLAGASSLYDFEVQAIGDRVRGKDLVHLQCHFGQDTLSWARHGAKVWGLDFSQPAIEHARRLAAAAQLDTQAEFVCADVYDATRALGRTFDVVYTGIGALCWLPDIERWAEQVRSLLRPGGTFYIVEMHPTSEILSDADLVISRSYFHDRRGEVDNSRGTYADKAAATTHNTSISWAHPFQDLFAALFRHGFRVGSFQEHDFCPFQYFDFMTEERPGVWRLPPAMPQLPWMYSLSATI
jgi:SAM-dependent methyltransferase